MNLDVLEKIDFNEYLLIKKLQMSLQFDQNGSLRDGDLISFS
jgi:hypothetical protein